jgi:hypothetical protein
LRANYPTGQEARSINGETILRVAWIAEKNNNSLNFFMSDPYFGINLRIEDSRAGIEK